MLNIEINWAAITCYHDIVMVVHMIVQHCKYMCYQTAQNERYDIGTTFEIL